VVAFSAGIALSWAHPEARAQEPTAGRPKLMCRYFSFDLKSPPSYDTSDRTTEIGQWVGAREDEGWYLYGIDFETAQKPTGFPEGWAQVCMYPG
jgi:hypothetical protein